MYREEGRSQPHPTTTTTSTTTNSTRPTANTALVRPFCLTGPRTSQYLAAMTTTGSADNMAPTATPALSPIGRQKGKTVIGTLKRGAPAATLRENTGAKSTSSIPTKYETVLSTTPVEQDAFGTRTQRFSHAENDLPGPGKYYKPRKAMFEYDNSQSSQVHPSRVRVR